MDIKWYFRKLKKDEEEHDSHDIEFFNLDNPPTSLVREVIQNSIDAKLEEKNKLKLTFRFGKTKLKENKKYYKPIIPHLKASNLFSEDYTLEDEFTYLVIEDFNTTGLEGETTQEEVIKSGNRGDYYSFWRCRGKSSKRGDKAGRWGIGKTVYHSSSKLKSFWGLTKRESDGEEILLGKVVMNTHILEKELYCNNGYYREKNSHKITEKEEIEKFKDIFNIDRDVEPGLSIVIPLPVDEITQDSIIKAVIMQYFYPIIKNRLIVNVKCDSDNSSLIIDQSELMSLVDKLDWDDSKWKDRDLKSLMKFLLESATLPEEKRFILNKNRENINFNEKIFNGEINKFIKDFKKGKFLAFRLLVDIKPKEEEKKESYVDIYIQKDNSLKKADEFYIRSGITIYDIGTLKNKPVRALLSAQDNAVSRFLGDSETPAHTDWNVRTEGFKEKYENTYRIYNFIKFSMREIIKLIDIQSEEKDTELLKDVFFIKVNEESGNGDKSGNKTPDITNTSPPELEINKIKEGFHVKTTENIIEYPVIYSIKVAYNIRRKNPFRHYRTTDFDFEKGNLDIKMAGGKFIKKEKNIIVIEILSSVFDLNIKGFDQNRDLIIDLKKIKND